MLRPVRGKGIKSTLPNRIEILSCAVRFSMQKIDQSFGAVAGTSSIRMVFIHSAAMPLRSVMAMPA